MATVLDNSKTQPEGNSKSLKQKMMGVGMGVQPAFGSTAEALGVRDTQQYSQGCSKAVVRGKFQCSLLGLWKLQ